jgi:dihydroorotate dehydrogenase (NAD+) catalytic subunit
MDLTVSIGRGEKKLVLTNPVITASGTFGYGIEYADVVDIQQLGAIICKGTTLKPREGNPQPRLVETAGGVLNSIGLQNIGVDALIKEKAPVWAGWRVPVIVNIAGDIIEDYGELAEKLDKVKGVSALEINISCPNVKAGCALFGADPEAAAQVTLAVKSSTTLPVIVKLTPNTNNILAVAKAAAAAGADALSLVNSFKGMAIDIVKKRPSFENITAGLSGPAIKPLALALVYEVAGAIDVPVIGLGGIATAADALEFLMAGASAVQVGSATYRNPRAALDILEGIERYMEKEGIRKIGDIIGAARPAGKA